MDDLFTLPAGVAKEVGLRRACQVALLRERLQEAGRQYLSGWLEALSLADLLQHATPFFWLNVRRCHAACGRADTEPAAALRYLLMTAFDAFFALAPDGLCCRLPAGEDPVLVLPRLGVCLQASAGPAQLCRVDRSVVRVEYGPGQAATVQRDRVSAGCRLAWLPVGRSSARLLLQFHPALFPDSFAKDMQTSGAPGAGQAAEITEALRLIQEVDPRLGEQIETGIRWYASLISPSPEVHRSRTARNLHGVIFLSPGQSRSVVAEAIVHEYCHDVLHTWMERERLINFGNEARFYSPWREDPRPLAGLLHALYVFTAVAEFLREAEASPALTEESAVLRDRRLLLVEQLRLGYAQAPREHFTPAGRQLLTGLKDIIDRHEAELDLPRDRLPDSLVAHLRKWCAAHFHLAVQVRRPIRSGA